MRNGFRRYARRLRVEDVTHGFFRVFGQQPREGDRPQVAIVAIDHEQPVGLVRQLRAHTQVAQYDFHGDVGAHAYRVGVHEAAGGVVLEGQHGLQPLAVLLVHGLDQLQRHGLGQISDQVGQVVEFHVLGGRQQFVGVHPLDERLAHVIAELDQYVAFNFWFDEVPDHLALRGRQRFHERRDLRRMHRGDHSRRAAPGSFAQCAAQRSQAALFAGDYGGLGHFGRECRWVGARIPRK